MKYIKFALAVYVLSALISCASISQESQDQLAKPVNCETATQDIAALEGQKASRTRRMTAGVTSVMPMGAAQGLATGDTRARGSVATGRYNQQIDEKIAEIKKTCGLN